MLEKIITNFPAKRWLIIEDNLSIHINQRIKLALTGWPNIQILFISRYVYWLNLIEPWWKQLRSLAPKGTRFKNLDKLTSVWDYWNIHRYLYVWKKEHQEQVTLLDGYGICKDLDIATV